MSPSDAHNLIATSSDVRRLDVDVDAIAGAVDAGWVLFSGFLVFFMHVGFSMLEGGTCKPQNRQSILLKNISATCMATIAWFLFGYGLAFGEDNYDADRQGGLYGTNQYFAGEKALLTTGDHKGWFFQWTFCATAATIVSGALAERTRLAGFLVVAFWLTVFSYPIVVHWAWAGGMLSKIGSQSDHAAGAGYLDFAGSGVVHMFGGFNALVGAIVVGPRKGRFDDPTMADSFRPSNPLLVLLGTFFLWFGWYGFNAGSTGGLSGGSDVTAARCCITTTCAAAAGGLTCMLLSNVSGTKKQNLSLVCNGILAGLVSITAGCSNVQAWASMFIGAFGAIVMCVSSLALEKLKVDDVVGAFPVHGAAGMWGVLAAGLFDLDRGLFYLEGNANGAFGPALIGVVAIMLWAVLTAAPVFLGLRAANLLRISPEVEAEGLDYHHFVPLATLVPKVSGSSKTFGISVAETPAPTEGGISVVVVEPLDVGFGQGV